MESEGWTMDEIQHWQTAIQLLKTKLQKRMDNATFFKVIGFSDQTFRRYAGTATYTIEQYEDFFEKAIDNLGYYAEFSDGKPLLTINSLKKLDLVVHQKEKNTQEYNTNSLPNILTQFINDQSAVGLRFKGDYIVIGQSTENRYMWEQSQSQYGQSHKATGYYIWPLQIASNGQFTMRTHIEGINQYGLIHQDQRCLTFLYFARGTEQSQQINLAQSMFPVYGRDDRGELYGAELGLTCKPTRRGGVKAEKTLLVKIDDCFTKITAGMRVSPSDRNGDIHLLGTKNSIAPLSALKQFAEFNKIIIPGIKTLANSAPPFLRIGIEDDIQLGRELISHIRTLQPDLNTQNPE